MRQVKKIAQDNAENLSQFVRIVADIMQLKDWKFEIVIYEYDKKDENYAYIYPDDVTKKAQITFTQHFWRLSDKEKTKVIIHELLHCYFNEIEHFYETIKSFIPHQTYAILEKMLEKNVEKSIESLSECMVHFIHTFNTKN